MLMELAWHVDDVKMLVMVMLTTVIINIMA